jgi:hypothetical protein
MTSLGVFSPIRWLFNLGSFLKLTELVPFSDYGFPRIRLCIIFDIKWIWLNFGQFFTNSSGHPDNWQDLGRFCLGCVTNRKLDLNFWWHCLRKSSLNLRALKTDTSLLESPLNDLNLLQEYDINIHLHNINGVPFPWYNLYLSRFLANQSRDKKWQVTCCSLESFLSGVPGHN